MIYRNNPITGDVHVSELEPGVWYEVKGHATLHGATLSQGERTVEFTSGDYIMAPKEGA